MGRSLPAPGVESKFVVMIKGENLMYRVNAGYISGSSNLYKDARKWDSRSHLTVIARPSAQVSDKNGCKKYVRVKRERYLVNIVTAIDTNLYLRKSKTLTPINCNQYF